jgi:hypothetical protein
MTAGWPWPWLPEVARVRVRLRGTVADLDSVAGEVLDGLDAEDLPDRAIYGRCGGRRVSLGLLQAYGMWGGESLATPRGCGSAQPMTKGPTKLTSKRVSMGLPDLKQSTRMPAAGVQKFTLHCAELLPYAVTWTLPPFKKSRPWTA